MAFLIFKKVPAFPTLFIGTILGAITAVLFQKNVIYNLSQSDLITGLDYYKVILQSMFGEIKIGDELLNSQGMFGMLNTVWLPYYLCQMIFGGVMEKSGFLNQIANKIMTKAKSTSSLVATTAGSCKFFDNGNCLISVFYSIVVPGRMYKSMYKKYKIKF